MIEVYDTNNIDDLTISLEDVMPVLVLLLAAMSLGTYSFWRVMK